MKKNPDYPHAYFITFTTYGTWLHGDSRGSVDRNHNQYCELTLKPNKFFYRAMSAHSDDPFFLDSFKRKIALNTIEEICEFYDWGLFAAHVRTNHIHIILQAFLPPEKIMTRIKSAISREFNLLFKEEKRKKYWSRHGSTRYIWSSRFLLPVMDYVIEQQGKKLNFFCAPWYLENSLN